MAKMKLKSVKKYSDGGKNAALTGEKDERKKLVKNIVTDGGVRISKHPSVEEINTANSRLDKFKGMNSVQQNNSLDISKKSIELGKSPSEQNADTIEKERQGKTTNAGTVRNANTYIQKNGAKKMKLAGKGMKKC